MSRTTEVALEELGWREYLEAVDRFRRQAKRDLRRTAHHEAGHAVAAVVRGLKFDWAAIRPLDDVDVDESVDWLPQGEKFNEFYFGYVAVLPVRLVDLEDLADDLALMHLAGPLAELRFAGSKGRPHADDGDKKRLDDILRRTVPERLHGLYLREMKVQATVLVDRRWTEIEAVARSLIEHRLLTRRGVSRAMRGVSLDRKDCPLAGRH